MNGRSKRILQLALVRKNDYEIVEQLLKFEDGYSYDRTCPVKVNLRAHILLKLDCKARESSRYCKGCYKKKQDGLIEKK
ncbi:unnamed protein product [Acanthoscelides obtectus]|uniref:Uncharacterized protein n=1 Tax=Acanthoscelides obtectus TaxID=200917 RepID=A0A9P0MFV3_ACAOB|nr:unnamed protein product [Acanthoscelides obtectus]CAK1670842.1 hypothetical protein AOBTE_LOCUS27868 [Acanthoscelides obtectus]